MNLEEWDGARPLSCREYLGAADGYCTRPPTVVGLDGRGFCGQHAFERAHWAQKHTAAGDRA